MRGFVMHFPVIYIRHYCQIKPVSNLRFLFSSTCKGFRRFNLKLCGNAFQLAWKMINLTYRQGSIFFIHLLGIWKLCLWCHILNLKALVEFSFWNWFLFSSWLFLILIYRILRLIRNFLLALGRGCMELLYQQE